MRGEDTLDLLNLVTQGRTVTIAEPQTGLTTKEQSMLHHAIALLTTMKSLEVTVLIVDLHVTQTSRETVPTSSIAPVRLLQRDATLPVNPDPWGET